MEEIKAKFAQKQNDFLKKFKTEIDEHSKSNEVSAHICNICHNEVDTTSVKAGTPAYFGYSNILSLGTYQTRMKTVIAAKSFKGREDLLRKLIILNSKGNLVCESFPIMQTCGHYLHRECYEKHSR